MALSEQKELKPAVVASARSIYRIVIDKQQNFFEVDWMYEDADGNPIPSETKVVQLTDQDFVDIGNELTLDGETIYDAIKRISYAKGA